MLSTGRISSEDRLKLTDDSSICRWCLTPTDTVDKLFVGERMFKTVCCEANVCSTCICSIAELRHRLERKNRFKRPIPCLCCKEKCVSIDVFPDDEQDANYKLQCGFLALYWVTRSFLVHAESRKKKSHWWMIRRVPLCNFFVEDEQHRAKRR